MVKVGLIGAGFLGKIHLGLIKQLDHVDFVGFYDIDEKNSENLAINEKVRSFTHLEDLLSHVDAVVIASPTITHFETAQHCLRKKISMFIEKPVTATLAEALQLKVLLEGAQSKVQIGMVERFNPAFVAATAHIRGSDKIFCNRLAPYTPRGADVSVVMDVMIHDLDIVLSITESKVAKIAAHGEKIISNTYDLAQATVEFENGLVAHFTASRAAERKYRLIEFVNETETCIVDFLNKRTHIYNGLEVDKDESMRRYLDSEWTGSAAQEIPIIEWNAIEEELKSFIECIINNKKVVVSLDDGIRAMELAQRIEAEMNHQK